MSDDDGSPDVASTLSDALAEHPRLAGMVFATLLALSTAGSAAAGHGSTVVGP